MNTNGKDDIASSGYASSLEKGGKMLCIFNPEHDLCLANGGAHYVPPQSALKFAADCKDIMRLVYGEGAAVADAAHLPEYSLYEPSVIVPWGWNVTLRQQLLSAGYPEALLPAMQQMEEIRRLQNRATAQRCLVWLAQQTGTPYPAYTIVDKIPDAGGISDKAFWQISSSAVVPAECLSHLLDSHGRLVLKAPWSGSGRGLRWLQGRVGDKDKEWIVHILKQQGSVAAEPWEEVMQEFAMEFVLDDDVRFAGFSLFSARGGVYQGNVLLTDRGIEQRLGEYVSSSMIRHIQLLLTYWLRQHVLPYYKGPLGVDMYIHDSPRGPRLRPCSEINFRHTMGLVAHEYLRRHQQEEGKVFAIRYVASTYHYSCC